MTAAGGFAISPGGGLPNDRPQTKLENMVLRVVACFALLSLVGGSAEAQERLFALTSGSEGDALWEARVEGGQVADPTLRAHVPARGGEPIVVGGGRFLAWSTSGALAVFDRQTGSAQLVPQATEGALVADPTATQLYFGSGGQIGRLSATGVSLVPGTAGLTVFGVSTDGRRLYTRRLLPGDPPQLTQFEIIDAASGALLTAVPLGEAGSVHVAADETAVWVVQTVWVVNVGTVSTLRKLAVPSGDELLNIPLPAHAPYPPSGYRIVGTDASQRRVFVVMNAAPLRYTPSGEVRSFDTDTGAAGPVVTTGGVSSVFLDAAAGRVLAYSASPYAGACYGALFQVLSAVTGEEVSQVWSGEIPCLRVAFAAPPPPPTIEAPIVTAGRTVTLTWSRAPELITQFTVEAGTGPGLANLAVLSTSGTTLTVPNVAPGTYYVRVKAANYIGDSAPSNEIVVTVP